MTMTASFQGSRIVHASSSPVGSSAVALLTMKYIFDLHLFGQAAREKDYFISRITTTYD